MRFDLFDLELFARIADTSSLTRAAHELNVSTPSVSARIRNLEESFGVRLLNRDSGGVKLTAAGQTFLRHAQCMLEQTKRMRHDLQEYAQGIRGSVTILANTSAMTEFLPPLLKPYLLDHPSIVIDVHEHLTSEIVDAVNKGVADIGLIVGNIPLGDRQAIPSWEDRLVLAVPVGHPLAGRAVVAFEETLDFDYVLLAGAGIIRTCIEGAARELKRSLKVHVEVGNFETACRMVENSMGVSILPQRSAIRHAASMKITTVGLSDAWAVRKLQILVRDLESKPRFVKDVVEFLSNRRDVVEH